MLIQLFSFESSAPEETGSRLMTTSNRMINVGPADPVDMPFSGTLLFSCDKENSINLPDLCIVQYYNQAERR
ncbi:MAG TPA: hypothetical protein VKR53_15390 [Puia sp.]|nr:hypothetical protein [Puia sp.]